MKITQSLFFMLLVFATLIVDAKSQSKNQKLKKSPRAAVHKKVSNTQPMGAKLGTDFQFNDMSVRGQYQSAFEGRATVENDKGLNDLLDYRTDYNDRLAVSKGQR